MLAVQYVGDDGTTYQIAQPAAYSGFGAGNLPAATGTEPPLPFRTVARHMWCIPQNPANGEGIAVCCDANNPAFLHGPGAVLLVGTQGYNVTQCFGEVRRT